MMMSETIRMLDIIMMMMLISYLLMQYYIIPCYMHHKGLTVMDHQ